jgi:hypothetical protein
LVRKELTVTGDPEFRAELCEKVPQQHLIRRDDRASKRGLQTRDRTCRPESVAPNEDCLGVIADVSRRPVAHSASLDPARIVRELGGRRRHDVHSLALKVRRAQLVDLVAEPRWVNQRNSGDIESSECKHARGACCCDRDGDSP